MYTEGLVREGKQSRRIYQVHNSIKFFFLKKKTTLRQGVKRNLREWHDVWHLKNYIFMHNIGQHNGRIFDIEKHWELLKKYMSE